MAAVVGILLHYFLVFLENDDIVNELILLAVLEFFPIIFYLIIQILKKVELDKELKEKLHNFTDQLHDLELRTDAKIKTISGENLIFEFIEKQRSLVKTEIRAIWCKEKYSQRILDYFTAENELRGIARHRLIRVNVKNKENVKNHLIRNKQSLLQKSYSVYATNYNFFEIIILLGIGSEQGSLGLQIFYNRNQERMEWAIYSSEDSFIGMLVEIWDSIRQNSHKLEFSGNDTFDSDINTWIENAISSSESANKR
jgi:hypothetical protein